MKDADLPLAGFDGGLDLPADEIAILANEMSDQGDLTLARLILEDGVRKYPHESGLWHNLGRARSDMEEFQMAVAAYSQAILLGYESEVNRGYCYEKLGDLDQAEKDYRHALFVNPKDLDALVDLGTLLMEVGELDEAGDLLKQAASLDPKLGWQYADLLIELDLLSEAFVALETAVQAGEPRAHLDLAVLYANQGDTERTVSQFEAAISSHVKGARRAFALFLAEQR